MMSLNRPERPSIGSVASLLAMDRTTLTAALKPLQRRGLITVMVDAEDRRSRRLTLTPAGRALLGGAGPVWRGAPGEDGRPASPARGARPRRDPPAPGARRHATLGCGVTH